MDDSTHTAASDAPPLDTRFSILSDRRRRAVVAALSDRDPPMTVRELARAVSSQLGEAGADGASGGSIERISVALHHMHLPHLDDAGLVDYDTAANRVRSVETAHVEAVADLVVDAR